jgi:hypothetical protein
MDFDKRFSKEQFRDHLADLGVLLSDGDFDELLERTTKTTRRGQEFGFKPVEFALGCSADGHFHSGYSRRAHDKGMDAQTGKDSPTSFWIRLHSSEQVRFTLLSWRRLTLKDTPVH